jgi:hypothetical protein
LECQESCGVNDVKDFLLCTTASKLFLPGIMNLKRCTSDLDGFNKGESMNEIWETCKACGGELAEIRGRHPGHPTRTVCPTCLVETLETLVNFSQQATSAEAEARKEKA